MATHFVRICPSSGLTTHSHGPAGGCTLQGGQSGCGGVGGGGSARGGGHPVQHELALSLSSLSGAINASTKIKVSTRPKNKPK